MQIYAFQWNFDSLLHLERGFCLQSLNFKALIIKYFYFMPTLLYHFMLWIFFIYEIYFCFLFIFIINIFFQALLPFQIIFQIDKTSFQLLNLSSPLWKFLEQVYGLDIHFTQNKSFVSVVIRCSQERFPSLRQQILCLIELLTGKRGVSIMYFKNKLYI